MNGIKRMLAVVAFVAALAVMMMTTGAAQGVTTSTVVTNLDTVWAIDFAPNGHLFFSERNGRVSVWDGSTRSTVMTVPSSETSEGGTQGLALHPNFATSPFIYVYYSPTSSSNRLARYTYNPATKTAGSPVTLINGIPGASFHNGGRVKFGPDGKLYVSIGDAGTPLSSQSDSSLAGKILRLNDDGTIPSDNPNPSSRVYSKGHRNPQGLAWHPTTGDLWNTEHGPSEGAPVSAHDEVNRVVGGGNYGWPYFYGNTDHPNFTTPSGFQHTFPVRHSGTTAWAPGGATFYTGDKYPGWTGSLFYTGLGVQGGFQGGQVDGRAMYRLPITGVETPGTLERHFYNQLGRLRDVVQGPDGFLYLATSNLDGRGNGTTDRILRVEPDATTLAPPTAPTGGDIADGVGTGGDTTCTLNWDDNPAAEQVDKYRVYLLPNYNVDWRETSPVVIPAASEFTWTGLTNGQDYRFRVSAHNASATNGGHGPWSPASALPGILCQPVAEPPISDQPPSETGGTFSTWVPGAVGPVQSDVEARADVRRSTWEPRTENATANQRVPTDAELADFRAENQVFDPWAANVTGRPGLTNPTTDELIQWAAWKWGLDELLLRAQAAHESDWIQSAVGDEGMSFGLMQIKDHRPDGSPVHPGTHPLSEQSTAFNLDWAAGFLRYIRVNHCPTEDGMLSRYFNGVNCDEPDYVASVRDHLARREWLTYGTPPPPPPPPPLPSAVVVDQVTLQGGGCLIEFQQRPASESVDAYVAYQNSEFTGWDLVSLEEAADSQYVYPGGTTSDNYRMSAYNEENDTDANPLTGSAGHGPWGAAVDCVDPSPPPPNQTPTIAWDMDNDGSADVPQPNDSTATVGEPVTYRVLASDPDDDPITVAWDDDTAAPPVYDDGTGLAFTKTYATAGEFEVGAQVSDGRGGVASIRQFVTVEEAPPPPPPPPTAPSDPTGFAVATAEVTEDTCVWEWNDNPTAEAVIDYQAYPFTSATAWSGTWTDVTASRFVISGLAPGTTRFLKVSARNEVDYSDWVPNSPDPAVACTTDGAPPPPPPPPGDIFDEPFPNSPTRRPAAGIAFDQFSSNLVNRVMTNARDVNSGRGPTIFTDATRFRGDAGDPVWTMIGSSVGGSTTIRAPQNIGDSGGIDPTIVIHDVVSGKSARMYCGSGGTCSYDRTNHILRGQNLGVDTNGDGQAEQGAGTAWRRLNPEGAALASDRLVMDHRVGVAVGNNDNAVGQFRFPALAQEVQATGPSYPTGVPMGTTFCHLWTTAEIDGFQNANGMSGATRQFSDAYTEATSCTRGYGIVTRDGTGTNGFNLYINTGELGLSTEQGRQAVRMGAGGGGSTSIPFYEDLSKWRALVAG